MLDPADMSLRDLIRWLTTPANCGFYLSIADFARIGATFGIQIAPMNRHRAVEQLIRSAALDDRVPDLFAVLRAEMESQLHKYRSLDHPALNSWIELGAEALQAWDQIERALQQHLAQEI